MTKVLAIAADHAGVSLKEALAKEAKSFGFAVEDLGTNGSESVDYPNFAHELAAVVLEKKAEVGVLICGTGIGMSIAANRHKGIRAAVCRSAEEARLSRQHNNANVLCLGARITSPEVALECLKTFLSTEFEGGRHARRVDLIEC